MRESQHLPDGVTICDSCGELYTEELTLSEYCEPCDFYADDFDFGIPNLEVDTTPEIDEDGEITEAAIANRNRLLDEMIRRETQPCKEM